MAEMETNGEVVPLLEFLKREMLEGRVGLLRHGLYASASDVSISSVLLFVIPNASFDELISLAAALQTMVAYLLSPASPADPFTDEPVDIGGPDPLGRSEMRSLYGFNRTPHPQAEGYYEWPDMTFKLERKWWDLEGEGVRYD